MQFLISAITVAILETDKDGDCPRVCLFITQISGSDSSKNQRYKPLICVTENKWTNDPDLSGIWELTCPFFLTIISILQTNGVYRNESFPKKSNSKWTFTVYQALYWIVLAHPHDYPGEQVINFRHYIKKEAESLRRK